MYMLSFGHKYTPQKAPCYVADLEIVLADGVMTIQWQKSNTIQTPIRPKGEPLTRMQQQGSICPSLPCFIV